MYLNIEILYIIFHFKERASAVLASLVRYFRMLTFDTNNTEHAIVISFLFEIKMNFLFIPCKLEAFYFIFTPNEMKLTIIAAKYNQNKFINK